MLLKFIELKHNLQIKTNKGILMTNQDEVVVMKETFDFLDRAT